MSKFGSDALGATLVLALPVEPGIAAGEPEPLAGEVLAVPAEDGDKPKPEPLTGEVPALAPDDKPVGAVEAACELPLDGRPGEELLESLGAAQATPIPPPLAANAPRPTEKATAPIWATRFAEVFAPRRRRRSRPEPSEHCDAGSKIFAMDVPPLSSHCRQQKK